MSDIGTPIVGGTASHVGTQYGPDYIALPEGPGILVEVCGAGGCATRRSTDAGPDLAMQREPYNRVVDLNLWDFEKVCGCDGSVGLTQVTVEYLGKGPQMTLPPTDTEVSSWIETSTPASGAFVTQPPPGLADSVALSFVVLLSLIAATLLRSARRRATMQPELASPPAAVWPIASGHGLTSRAVRTPAGRGRVPTTPSATVGSTGETRCDQPPKSRSTSMVASWSLVRSRGIAATTRPASTPPTSKAGVLSTIGETQSSVAGLSQASGSAQHVSPRSAFAGSVPLPRRVTPTVRSVGSSGATSPRSAESSAGASGVTFGSFAPLGTVVTHFDLSALPLTLRLLVITLGLVGFSAFSLLLRRMRG